MTCFAPTRQFASTNRLQLLLAQLEASDDNPSTLYCAVQLVREVERRGRIPKPAENLYNRLCQRMTSAYQQYLRAPNDSMANLANSVIALGVTLCEFDQC